MVYRVDSHNASFITRIDLTLSQWAEKLDRFISLTGFLNDLELVKQFSFEYNLDYGQESLLKDCLHNNHIKYFRYSYSKYEGFKIEPIYLDIKNSKGRLIYWKDWDFVFQQISEEYYLWCFLGGIADLQREIRLSNDHVEKYKEIGLAQIDYLIDDLKRLNNSKEYERAINEGRKII